MSSPFFPNPTCVFVTCTLLNSEVMAALEEKSEMIDVDLDSIDLNYPDLPSSPLMNGYLEKESLYFKTYRKRWIELKDNCLYSYKDEAHSDEDETEMIDLNSFEYIERTKDNKFKLVSSDKKTQRQFIAPTSKVLKQWVDRIKDASKIQELSDKKGSIHLELSEDQILWNDTDKIWEYYWKSDGRTTVHGAFTCKEMAKRNRFYFAKAEEPIVFKRVDAVNWIDSWSVDLMEELKKWNKHKINLEWVPELK